MALKVLMLRKKIDDKKKALNALLAKDAELEKREAELEQSITEAQTEEETKFLDEEIAKHDAEKQAQAEAKAQLEKEISDMEQELGEEEKEQEVDAPAPAEEPAKEERKDNIIMNTRSIFAKMSMTERDAFFGRDDVKEWLGVYRSAMKNRRSVVNVGLTIPEVVLPLLRENILNWSKLYDRVNVVAVGGEARQPILGTIPEAIWTECCANLNELSLGFTAYTMDCYMVAGYFAVCNANLQDSDVDLADEILTALGQAIGKALDKAILYGRNSETTQAMPLGVVPAIASANAPANYPATARPWVNLSATHIVSLNSNYLDTTLFKLIVENSAVVSGDYSRGELTWVMNDKTYKKLLASAMVADANGALVSRVDGTMPVIGGAVRVLPFIPDDEIIYGYFDLYTLAERRGREFAQSEHVMFLNNMTVFRGVARYDGAPVIREAFAILNIGTFTDSPAQEVQFAPDTANSSSEGDGEGDTGDGK